MPSPADRYVTLGFRFTYHCHENRALICMDEPYALVIPAQAVI